MAGRSLANCGSSSRLRQSITSLILWQAVPFLSLQKTGREANQSLSKVTEVRSATTRLLVQSKLPVLFTSARRRQHEQGRRELNGPRDFRGPRSVHPNSIQASA